MRLLWLFAAPKALAVAALQRSPWPPFSARRGRPSAPWVWALGPITCHSAKFPHSGVVEGFITPPAVSSCEVSEVMRSCGGAVQGVSEERTQPMSGAVALNRQVSSGSTSSSSSSSNSSSSGDSVCPSHSGDTHSAPLALCVQVDLALTLTLTLTLTARVQVDGFTYFSDGSWAGQHGQSAALAVPQLSSCASSGRAWRLWPVRDT